MTELDLIKLAEKLKDSILSGTTFYLPAEEPTEVEETEATLGEALTEALKEEKEVTDPEVSADEFEKLINEPEFKKPISDSAVRAMMASDKEAEEGTSSKKESTSVEATEAERLEENKFTDWLARRLTTDTAKADWILANTPKDKNKVKIEKNRLVIGEGNKKYKAFMVVYFKNKFSDGQPINKAPTIDNKNLMPAKKPELKTSYKFAADAAKGWSMQESTGPAFIYLVGDAQGADAAFLCQYFNGSLCENNISKYFKIIQNDIAGIKLETRSKAGNVNDAGEEAATETVVEKKIKGSEIVVGTKLKFDEGVWEVTKIEESKFGASYKAFTMKSGADETTENLPLAGEVITLVETDTTEDADTDVAESFNTKTCFKAIVESLDEIQEGFLEENISTSLVENYGNVAGFRVTDCEYVNENLKVNGTVFFTSGNRRNITYTFTEGCITRDGKAQLRGLNEKLGLDKRFTLTGKIDETNKTFITESFTRNK
jgi:hypothetical protein